MQPSLFYHLFFFYRRKCPYKVRYMASFFFYFVWQKMFDMFLLWILPIVKRLNEFSLIFLHVCCYFTFNISDVIHIRSCMLKFYDSIDQLVLHPYNSTNKVLKCTTGINWFDNSQTISDSIYLCFVHHQYSILLLNNFSWILQKVHRVQWVHQMILFLRFGHPPLLWWCRLSVCNLNHA